MERRTFEVGVEHFDGPIDLLLHLVKSRELEISRISLAQVASQYLAYVEMMKGEELEVAAEYLVVAATLLSIKASFLLKQPSEFAEEEDSLPDPQKELLARLREAEIYKDGAEALGAVKQLGIEVFKRDKRLEPIEGNELPDHDVMLLGKAFSRLLERTKCDVAGLNFEIDTMSIVERMTILMERLQVLGGRAFLHELVEVTARKIDLVGSFIAVLELCRRGILSVNQEDNFGDIAISFAGKGSEVDEELLASA